MSLYAQHALQQLTPQEEPGNGGQTGVSTQDEQHRKRGQTMATDCKPNARKADKQLHEDVGSFSSGDASVPLCACTRPLAAHNMRYRLSMPHTLHATTSCVPHVVNTPEEGGWHARSGGAPCRTDASHERPGRFFLGLAAIVFPLCSPSLFPGTVACSGALLSASTSSVTCVSMDLTRIC